MDDIEENETEQHREGVKTEDINLVGEEGVVGVCAGDKLNQAEDDPDLDT